MSEIEICHLLYRYAEALDQGSTEAWLDFFEPDATVSGDGFASATGRSEIARLHPSSTPGRIAPRHLIFNPVASCTGSEGRATAVLALASPSAAGGVSILALARYAVELVRHGDQWRIRRLHVAIDLPVTRA